MPRYVALLRAINVGGHTVKMDALSAYFRELGFTSVETFIASGNVIFASPTTDEAILTGRIERCLREALGYEVATFLRSVPEVVDIAAYDPYPGEPLPPAGAMNIGFLAKVPDAGSSLQPLETEIDRLHFHGREIYWRCLVRQSHSKVSGASIERAIGARLTMRGISTVQRLAAKYGNTPN